jgi:hypothetical protein
VRRLLGLGLLGAVLLPPLAVMLFVTVVAGQPAADCGLPAGPAGPVGGVPASDVTVFQGAALQFGLGDRGPSVLAAINYVESDFGQSNLPGVHSGANAFGAAGPMQIGVGGAAGDAWLAIGVSAPGDPPGQPPDVYNEADAVYSAAHYLRLQGAPGNWPGAVFAYNHSSAYVQQVLARASRYRVQGLAATGATGGLPASAQAGLSTLGGSDCSAGSSFAPPGSGEDPIPGFTIGRDDMGVDANAPLGTAIYAPLDSRLAEVLPGWFASQPLLLFKFLSRPAGAPSDYWYVAEQIDPVTEVDGTIFRARQVVATYAASGTGIEIGWGSATSNQRTLAGETDPGAANPPAGATTEWGESFKRFFGIH